jgi:hypothetical protein
MRISRSQVLVLRISSNKKLVIFIDEMKNNKFFIEENLSEYRRGEIFNIFHGRVKVGVAYYHM